MTAEDPWRYERDAWASGSDAVAGVDEVGRGPLAGPVVAACVLLPKDFDSTGIGDSKKLTAKQRESAFSKIAASGAICGVGCIESTTIDSINILKATHAAMLDAVNAALNAAPIDFLLIDGLPVPSLPIRRQKAIVGGDGKSVSIGCASIVAKVLRDRMMCDYDTVYPGYGFKGHKGYGSAGHMDAISKLGPCPIHRRSFAPFKDAATTKLKPSHNPLGRRGEDAAAELLTGLGFNIVDTNVRPILGTGRGELDIICWDGPCLVFVEVKTRNTSYALSNEPLEAMTYGKRNQILSLARAYIGRHQLNDVPCRFDVVEVRSGNGSPLQVRLIRNAFDAQY